MLSCVNSNEGVNLALSQNKGTFFPWLMSNYAASFK